MARTFTKLGKQIAVAVKAGGPEPENNPTLRAIIATCKRENMPKDNIERAIKNACGKDQSEYKTMTYEGYGPHGVAIFVDTLTDNATRTVGDVRSVFNKFNGNLGTMGSLAYLFDHKAVFTIRKKDGVDMDELKSYTTDNRITYERLVEIAEQALKVLDPDGSKGLIGFDFQQVDRVYQMNQLPNSMGGAQVSADGFSLDGVLNTDAWKNALTWYQEQVKKGICSRGITASEIPNYFYSDKCLFMLCVTNMVANCKRNNMEWFGIMPSPAFKGYEDKVATPTGSWHYGVNANSEKIEEAAKFVKWLTCSDEGPTLFYETDGMIPTYLPLLDKLSADESTVDWMKLAITESKTTAYPRALTPAFNEYSAVLNAVWSDTRNGEDVDETIEWAIEEYAAQTQKYKQ